MTDTPTIEQRARALAAAATQACGWEGVGKRLLEGRWTPEQGTMEGDLLATCAAAITEAEAIGEARGMETAAIADAEQVGGDGEWAQSYNEGCEDAADAIRKEAAERAGGGA